MADPKTQCKPSWLDLNWWKVIAILIVAGTAHIEQRLAVNTLQVQMRMVLANQVRNKKLTGVKGKHLLDNGLKKNNADLATSKVQHNDKEREDK